MRDCAAANGVEHLVALAEHHDVAVRQHKDLIHGGEERGLIAFLERNVVPAAKAEAREAVAAA